MVSGPLRTVVADADEIVGERRGLCAEGHALPHGDREITPRGVRRRERYRRSRSRGGS